MVLTVVFSCVNASNGIKKVNLVPGINAHESLALSEGLKKELHNAFSTWLISDFAHQCYGSSKCRKMFSFELGVHVASLHLSNVGSKEIIVRLEGKHICGTGGCRGCIFGFQNGKWAKIGDFFPANNIQVSSLKHHQYRDIYFKEDGE